MIEMIIGRAGTGKTFECLQRAKKILETEPLKTEIIFFIAGVSNVSCVIGTCKFITGSDFDD